MFDAVMQAINEVGVLPEQRGTVRTGRAVCRRRRTATLCLWQGRSICPNCLPGSRQVGVLNTTVEKPLLNPGNVYRKVVVIDGAYRVRTEGIGHGWFGLANVLLAEHLAWQGVDRRVIDRFRGVNGEESVVGYRD